MKIQKNSTQTTNSCQHYTLENDPYVLRKVLNSYQNYLHLNENRIPNSRTALKFIGKIKRTALEIPSTNVSKTLDYVYIYQRNLQHKGYTMPICFKIKIITTWKNGSPINHSKFNNEKVTDETTSNFLCCLPIFSLIQENQQANYEYFLSSEDINVGYSDIYSRLLQHALPIEKTSEKLVNAYKDVEDLYQETLLNEEKEREENIFFEQLKFDKIVKVTIYEYNPLKQPNLDELIDNSNQFNVNISSSSQGNQKQIENDKDEEEEQEEQEEEEDEDYIPKYSKYNNSSY